MKSQTIAVSISVSLQKVYAFASNPKNLPQWAPSTVKEIQRKDNKWIVPSPDGPVEFAFVETNSFGVLDHKVRLPSGEELYNPMRVFANGAGSEVTFTLFQHQGMSDQQFQKDAAHVLGDLQTLRQILESASE